jgi:hypothetical protein
MSRRRLLVSAASGGALLAGALPRTAGAATDDELTFANFGVATELLLEDYYGKIVDAKLFDGQLSKSFSRGGFAAGEHATALSGLLTDSGQSSPAPEDFEFAWPAETFKTKKAAADAGATIVTALCGAYLTGAATSPTSSFRTLYASLAASCGEQLSTLWQAQGRPTIGNSFPSALDLETASDAVESFLG